MTDEETRGLMDFILRQQAQLTSTTNRIGERLENLAVRVDALTENVDALGEKLNRLSDKVDDLVETQRRAEKRWEQTEQSVRALLAIAETHEREITALREAQERTDRQMAETDERLNSLMITVERFFSNGRGGKGGGDN